MMRDAYYDIDMVNCHPVILARLYDHLDIPYLKAYATPDGRKQCFDAFTEATGLPSRYCKMVVASFLFGGFVGVSSDKFDGEIWRMAHLQDALREHGITCVEDLNQCLRSISFLGKIKADRQKVCDQLRLD